MTPWADRRARSSRGDRGRKAAAGLLAVAVVGGLAGGCGGPAANLDTAPVDRVLVVSLPGLAWDDVRDADLPHLDRFVDHAAIADMATRIGRDTATATDAYLTLGAGTRAVAPVLDTAVAVDPGETYGGVDAADLGPEGRVVVGVDRRADGEVGDAVGDVTEPSLHEVGELGDRLAAAGVDRAVVANADAAEGIVSEDPPPEGAFARGAATMLMGSDGVVPGGTVGRDLLADDPTAAFGRRRRRPG